MGLLSGSCAFVKYSVLGDLPQSGFWEFVADRVRRNAFQDIDDNFNEFSIGWVSVADLLDSSFEISDYAVADNIVLGLRVDQRKVSGAILKKFCAKEEARIKKERGIPKLSRDQRLEIKENITLKLVKQALPTPVKYDLWWNLAENTVYFFSTQGKAQELLEDFFKRTFDLGLMRQIPYTVAENLLAGDILETPLADLYPAEFV